MRYLERLKQRATNINVLTQNKSSYLLAHVVLEEDLLDLGGDQVGVQAAGQGICAQHGACLVGAVPPLCVQSSQVAAQQKAQQR